MISVERSVAGYQLAGTIATHLTRKAGYTKTTAHTGAVTLGAFHYLSYRGGSSTRAQGIHAANIARD
jgi:hypothetical protein